MEQEYKTILLETSLEYEEKKSKFISYVKPVDEESKALAFLEKVKAKHKDATHNIYAYFISTDRNTQRYSDDGEPTGTAGLPTIEVIKRMNVRDIIVVTTRYFGGIQLGKAGLIRAYSKSAMLGIETGKIVKKIYCCIVKLTIEYTLYGKVRSYLEDNNYDLIGTEYLQDVQIELCIPALKYDYFERGITEITNMNMLIEENKMLYATYCGDGKQFIAIY